jgi:hypothetical protein
MEENRQDHVEAAVHQRKYSHTRNKEWLLARSSSNLPNRQTNRYQSKLLRPMWRATACCELYFILDIFSFICFPFLSFSVSLLVCLFLSYSIHSFLLLSSILLSFSFFLCFFPYSLIYLLSSFVNFILSVATFLCFSISRSLPFVSSTGFSFLSFIYLIPCFLFLVCLFLSLFTALYHSPFLLSEIKKSCLLVSAPKIYNGSMLLVSTRH